MQNVGAITTRGQLGDNSLVNKSTPVAVSGLAGGITAISAGGAHSCALLTSGGVQCWGHDAYGQLGNDSAMSNKQTPVAVQGVSGVVALSVGWYHSCALTSKGEMKCWGFDSYGDLGDDAALVNQPLPVTVQGLNSGVISISAGGHHTCAVRTGGALACWGYDSSGQLGNDAALTNMPTPADVLP